MAGKFEVYEDQAGKFRFRLKAGNGEVVASGQGYESLAGAKARVRGRATSRRRRDRRRGLSLGRTKPKARIRGCGPSGLAPPVGLEPTTLRLTVECSAN